MTRTNKFKNYLIHDLCQEFHNEVTAMFNCEVCSVKLSEIVYCLLVNRDKAAKKELEGEGAGMGKTCELQ